MSSEIAIVSRAGALDPARLADVRARVDAARRLLDEVGFAAGAPTIILDAALPSSAFATTLPGVVLLTPLGEADADVILHELVHVWMRAHGAHGDRWRLDGGVATHESALIHEGVADFVVAALTRDPIIAERSSEPGLARSVRVPVSCPDGLVGHAQHDAMVVASALWQLAEGNTKDVLAAVAASAPGHADNLRSFVAGLHDALEPLLAARWMALVVERGLLRCDDPLPIGAHLSARAADFLAVGTARFDLSEVAGPLAFRTAVDDVFAVDIAARSSRREPPLAVQWQAERHGVIVARGTSPLDGWPSQHTRVTWAVPADTLTFRFLNGGPDDLGFNEVAITHHLTPPPPPQGCAANALDGIALAVFATWVAWRRRA